ncbi:hypothetical protein ACROYT_G021402 [Oculina patagonica]
MASRKGLGHVVKIAPVLGSKERDELLDHETNDLSASDEEKDSGDEEKHDKLLKDIKSLSSSGKKKQRASQQRSEPNKTVSEFHLSTVKDSKQQVDLNDLIGSLNKSNEYGNLKKKLDSMQRNSGTLDVPLPKPEAQKIQRTVAYGETKKDIEKWTPTVKKNREAEHLSFPLKPYQPPVPSVRGISVNFKPRTPLEEEVAAVLRGSAHVLERSNKELTEEEEKALLAMDLEEAKERRHELQKLRALQSYYETKCRRMKKIKSKKYHRVKRKAEKRAAGKVAGEDQNENAEETLEKAERLRAMERVSLKHRNTSKWAKHLIAKGGKNADAKKLIQEQLRISRNLTEKTVESESDEEMETPAQDGGLEENADTADTYGNLLTSEDNPWKLDKSGTLQQETSSSLDNDASTKLHRLMPIRTEEARENNDEDLEHSDAGGEESEDEFELQPVILAEKTTKKSKKQKEVEGKKKKKRKSEGEVEVTAKKSKKSEKSNKTDSKKTAKESRKVSKKRLNSKSKDKIKSQNVTEDTIAEETENTAWTNSNVDIGGNSEKKISHKEQNGVAVSKDIRVDPKKIFRIEDHGNEAEEGESDSLQQKRIDIRKAFANDDVVEEFVKEKSEIEDASKPKDIDLSLPGWGSWAGAGIKPSEKKKKLFTKKADPAPPRKDKDLSHVIISEEKSKLFSKNQVSSVPHPYGSHVQFERSMRNPVGKHWNTGTTVNQLTKPRVETLIGTIIEPIKATKEIKRSKPEDRKNKKMGKESSGITIHS